MATVRLKHVGVLSVAKWQALVGAFIGFFLGVFYALSYVRGQVSLMLFYLITTPILYGAIAFASAALCALIYNAVASSSGGMLLEFEEVSAKSPLPPSPPNFR